MVVENLPIFFLILVGIGVIIILIGVVGLANSQGDGYYTEMNQQEDSRNLEELFSYFLQEEEKKNEDFRNMVRSEAAAQKEGYKGKTLNIKDRPKQQRNQDVFSEIIKRYHSGEEPETIAKNLQKGIGEVKLVLSLYAMKE